MTKNIMIVGVGGQGTLLASRIIGNTVIAQGYDVKISEVHGMSQRGGDVQSNLRLSTDPIWSDQIPTGEADVIISMEPMEALRYISYLRHDGIIVTSNKPFVNIPNYPDEAALKSELDTLPNVQLDIEAIAAELKSAKSANMVLLGMAAPYIGVLTVEQLRKAVSVIFARKGDAVVEANLRAFDRGVEASKK